MGIGALFFRGTPSSFKPLPAALAKSGLGDLSLSEPTSEPPIDLGADPETKFGHLTTLAARLDRDSGRLSKLHLAIQALTEKDFHALLEDPAAFRKFAERLGRTERNLDEVMKSLVARWLAVSSATVT